MAIDPITGLIDLASGIISRIWPDKTQQEVERLKIILAQEMNETTLATKQLDINAVEAASASLFVGGWRPSLGWTCSLIFAWVYLVKPMIEFIVTASGHPIPSLPALSLGEIMPVLLGMLGIGGMRTYERVRGVIPGGK